MTARSLLAALACVLIAGCSHLSETIDTTPLPTVASPPYICEYIPLNAVQQMTGLQDPLTEGQFTIDKETGYRGGACGVYQPTGEQLKALSIFLNSSGDPEQVNTEIRNGAKHLPEIIPGGVGYYAPRKYRDVLGAVAVLIWKDYMLVVEMGRGAEGRNHEEDVVALMRLIAPRLLTEPDTPPHVTQKGG
jgi:hypothetical protein